MGIPTVINVMFFPQQPLSLFPFVSYSWLLLGSMCCCGASSIFLGALACHPRGFDWNPPKRRMQISSMHGKFKPEQLSQYHTDKNAIQKKLYLNLYQVIRPTYIFLIQYYINWEINPLIQLQLAMAPSRLQSSAREVGPRCAGGLRSLGRGVRLQRLEPLGVRRGLP